MNKHTLTLKHHILFQCFLCLFVANLAVATPRIACDSPKYDFGTVIGKEKITREFVLRNKGDSTLKIMKIKDCCGVKSTISPMEIPPGSSVVCKSVFTTKSRYGKQDKQILIATNDRKKPYFELKMVGTLLRPVEFKPRLINLGSLLPDSEITQTITATNLLSKAVELQSVKSTIKGIMVEVVESNDRNWTVELKSVPSLIPGKLNGQIQLNFSSGTVTVPVIGAVKPIIQVVPDQIQFSTASSKATERLIMLRSGDGRPFEVLSAKLESGDGSVDTKMLADNRWQLKLTVIPDSLTSTTSVQVETSCKSQPTIIVPLSVR